MREYYYLSLGAGKQSSALALMIANKDERLPKEFWSAKVVFADTGHEKYETYRWLDLLSEQVEIIRLRREYTLLEYFYQKGQIPLGWVNPHCSSWFKQFVIHDFYRQRHGETGKDGKKRLRAKNVVIHEIMGIGFEEMQRMKFSTNKWLKKEYPLIDLKMTRDDCIDVIAHYMDWTRDEVIMNVPKSSCVFCPNQSNRQLRSAYKFYPKEFEFAFKVQENAIKMNPVNPPLWKKGLSLQDIVFSTTEDNELDDICDSGYCFV